MEKKTAGLEKRTAGRLGPRVSQWGEKERDFGYSRIKDAEGKAARK